LTIINQAIRRPFSDFKILLIGILLSFPYPGLSLFTGSIAFGYILECAKNSFNGKGSLPNWKDFPTLLIKGLLALVISVVYLIPFLVSSFIFKLELLYWAFITSPITGSILSAYNLFSLGGNYSYIGLVISGLFFLIYLYLIPAVLIQFIVKYKSFKILDLRATLKMVLSTKYLLFWLGLTVISFVIVITKLNISPIVSNLNLLGLNYGILAIFSAIWFIFGVFSYTIYGTILRK